MLSGKLELQQMEQTINYQQIFILTLPSYRRFPKCKIAASSLEISQFSLSVNISTCRPEQSKVSPSSFSKTQEDPLCLRNISSATDLKQLLSDSQHLHCRADVGVLLHIVSTVTHSTVTLQRDIETNRKQRKLLHQTVSVLSVFTCNKVCSSSC